MNTLLVFVKRPRPGEVKTRLIPALGAQKAAALYRVLAEAVERNTRADTLEYTRSLFFSPTGAEEEISSWWPKDALHAQEGSDLGARLTHAFSSTFREGASRAAVIGTDAPSVSRDQVKRSFAALDRCDLVLGPARDGGYYLMALKAEHPELFQGIPWSSPGVLATTEAQAERSGLTVDHLETLPDIDTPEDVYSEWELLKRLLASEPALLEACAPLAERVGRGHP
jgi:rSAM/selenodomain-associated transferase 1